MIKKTKILFYSGHGEIIGGDSQYLFRLIDGLNPDKYEIEIYTDKNPLFEERMRQYMSKRVKVSYLDTHPVLFEKNVIDRLYDAIKLRKGIFLARHLSALLDHRYFGHSGYRCLRYGYSRILRILTLAQLRENVHNAVIFNRLFKEKKGEIDIFHFNNGGYPAKTAGLVAIIIAHYNGISRKIMAIHNVPQKKRLYWISDYIFDIFIAKYCRRIICASERIKKEMHSKRKFLLSRLTTIYCGLDDARLFSKEEIEVKKKELGIKQSSYILSIAANLDENRKGHAVLFRAFVDVKKKHPEIILLVIGEGRKKEELMILSRNYGLRDDIAFLGYRNDAADINSIIDISIVPSIGFEATPYTVKEAMRAAKPVIATDAGGCEEAVVHGVTGLIVQQGNAKMLAGAILQLLDNKILMQKMGEAGRKLFLEKFLLSNSIAEHERVYDQFFTGVFL